MNPDPVTVLSATPNSTSDSADAADWLVFLTLEILGISGFIGNLTLLIVIIKSGLLERPSFIFIASLAIADVFHSTVTSSYFYPPIVIRKNVFHRAGIQIMNGLDWTAWGITLTHMIAICLDRLLAIVLFQSYARLVTVSRTVMISLLCWLCFASINVFFASMQFCCNVIPQPEFYTFGFEDSSTGVATINVYKPLYVPLEILAMLILATGNPIILVNVYEKYRRKRTLRAASVVLMEVGQSLSRQSMNVDASLARDIKIFLQITIVMAIFFVYMFIYYLFFYITEFSDKWSTMLNSICYSITHMINPIVYFSLNEQMQKQLLLIFNSMGRVKRRKAARVGRRNALCGVTSIVQAIAIATAAAVSEISPLIYVSDDSVEKPLQPPNEVFEENSEPDKDAEERKSTVTFKFENILENENIPTPLLNGKCHREVVIYSNTHVETVDTFTASSTYGNDMGFQNAYYVEPCEEDAFL